MDEFLQRTPSKSILPDASETDPAVRAAFNEFVRTLPVKKSASSTKGRSLAKCDVCSLCLSPSHFEHRCSTRLAEDELSALNNSALPVSFARQLELIPVLGQRHASEVSFFLVRTHASVTFLCAGSCRCSCCTCEYPGAQRPAGGWAVWWPRVGKAVSVAQDPAVMVGADQARWAWAWCAVAEHD